MERTNRIPEEKACRETIRGLLRIANISSIDEIHSLF